MTSELRRTSLHHVHHLKRLRERSPVRHRLHTIATKHKPERKEAKCLQRRTGYMQRLKDNEYDDLPIDMCCMAIVSGVAGQGWNTLSSFDSRSFRRKDRSD